MEQLKITDGFIHKVEKKLLKVVNDYYHADGLYVAIDRIEIEAWEEHDYSIDYYVRWGCMSGRKCTFEHYTVLHAGNGNLNFLAGQFHEKVLDADTDGNE